MRPYSPGPVRVAAGAWSSSRRSRQATNPVTDPDPIHRHSESTTHEAVTPTRRPKRHASFPLVHRGRRPNSIRCVKSAPTRTAQPARHPVAPIPIPMRAANPTASSAARQTSKPRSRHQIPIGPADRLSGLSRSDFLPWRFSDAGYRGAWTEAHAGVRETCTEADSVLFLKLRPERVPILQRRRPARSQSAWSRWSLWKRWTVH